VFQDGMMRSISFKSFHRMTSYFSHGVKKAELLQLSKTKSYTLLPIGSFSAIAGTFSLSFQSSFHLSLTVLVRYRSPIHI